MNDAISLISGKHGAAISANYSKTDTFLGSSFAISKILTQKIYIYIYLTTALKSVLERKR